MSKIISPDHNRKIPFKTKVGYSLGGTGDAIAYDFIGSFLLFFFTELAGRRLVRHYRPYHGHAV